MNTPAQPLLLTPGTSGAGNPPVRSGANPYLLPDGNVQIAFSGGRTSAYMLHQIIEANGLPFPYGVEVTFQNTGREMPETLDFVHQVGVRWGVPIVWLEYRAEPPFFSVVSHNSASRDGEPFEAMIEKRRFLPNQQSRFCTTELKVRTAKRYLRRVLGWDYWTNCVGIRADEAHRSTSVPKDRWTIWRPLVDAGVSKHDVAAFWRRQPFDLNLPNVRGNCWLGNCDGCFLKSEANIAAFTREYPARAAWWERMEARAAELTDGAGNVFSQRYSRAQMREMMDKQGDFLLSTEGALCRADDGECME